MTVNSGSTSRPVASLQDGDVDDRVIHVGTLSAAMFPALRLGYIVVKKDLAGIFASVRNANDICPPPLHQLAMTDFIQEGHLSRHIKRMRAVYLNRRSALVAAIVNELPEVLDLIEGAAGTRLCGLLPLGVPDTEVAREAAIAGLQIRLCPNATPALLREAGLILDCASLDPESGSRCGAGARLSHTSIYESALREPRTNTLGIT